MRQHLLIDADDTLWENNIYFEAAFEEFVAFLDHSHLAPEEIRAVLDEIELVNAQLHGYGSKNFGRNLQEAYRHLAERHIHEEDLRQVMSFAERILAEPLVLLEGVPETLELLAERHELTLFTKGDPEEQRLKVDRSGLGRFFGHCEIVKEKTAPAYRELVARRGAAPERTWMIGNSPKSDINPALASGINAVFVPHARTWRLELQEIRNPGPGQLLTVERFADLCLHF
jgi:putative hydrolase of the HAD superfamily